MFIWDFARSRIFEVLYRFAPRFFPPQHAKKQNDFGISMLLCHKDIQMAVYCLQSLFFQLGYALPLYVVDDGSLTPSDKQYLHQMFTIQIVDTHKALTLMKQRFGKYTHFLRYLSDPLGHIKKMKIASFFLSPFHKTICLEPDIVFLNLPKEILKFKEKGGKYYGLLLLDLEDYLMARNQTELVLRKLLYDKVGVNVDYLFNGGMMLASKNHLNAKVMALMNKTVKLSYKLRFIQGYYFEEILLGTIFDKETSVALDREKYLNLLLNSQYEQRNNPVSKRNIVFLHLTSFVRNIFMFEAVKAAIASRLFSRKVASI